MNKAKDDNIAYQAKYREDNRERILKMKRERYSKAQEAKGKTVRPNKIERLEIAKSEKTEFQRNYFIKKKENKERKEAKTVVVQEEKNLPKKVNNDKLYNSKIDSLYKELESLNPLDIGREKIVGEINNLNIKLRKK